MSESPPNLTVPASETGMVPLATPEEADSSGRIPLLILLLSAAVWLVISSLFALIASIKFHSPNFLAEPAWFTYGRVRPVAWNSFIYGFCVQAGLGFGIWLLARLGRTKVVFRSCANFGAFLWNLGVTVGVLGILAGDSTGFESFEMPGYAAPLVLFGFLFVSVSGIATFHRRAQRPLAPSQWFLLAALLWFPWIYSTASLLLITFPVRGVAQSVIAWWYGANLLEVWFGLVGLSAAFFVIPNFSQRPLHSRYLALFAFWALVLFAGWTGIPPTAPVPAWMPAASTVATVLLLTFLLAVGLNVYATTGRFALVSPQNVSLSFVFVGVAALMVAWLMDVAGVLLDANGLLHFSWFGVARLQLHCYGFFAMVLFGAVYFIFPLVLKSEFRWPKLIRAHFWCAVAGLVLVVLPLGVGGVLQAVEMADGKLAFMQIVKSGAMFVRVSTIGDLLLLVANGLFLVNLGGLSLHYYRTRVSAAYAVATEDLFKTAEAKA